MLKSFLVVFAFVAATSFPALAGEPKRYCAPENGLPWEVVTIPFGYAIVDPYKATYCTIRGDDDFFSCNGAYQTSFRLRTEGNSITLTSLGGGLMGYLEECEEGEPKAPFEWSGDRPPEFAAKPARVWHKVWRHTGII